MLVAGTLIQVKTRTKNDVFGEVVYEIVQVGLPAPEKHRKGINDGVKAVMLGGNGPSARKGYTVYDSEEAIRRNIAEGITKIIAPERKASIVSFYASQNK